jgi:hypothetical protein
MTERPLRLRMLTSGWITTGSDRGIRASVRGIRRCLARRGAQSSCTAALHIALAAEGLGRRRGHHDAVHLVATVETICYEGATPVLVDVDPVTRNIDLSHRSEDHAAHPRDRSGPRRRAALRDGCDRGHRAPPRSSRGDRGRGAQSSRFLPRTKRSCAVQGDGIQLYATKNLTTAEGGC